MKLGAATGKNGLRLALFVAFCTMLIAVTENNTREKIQEQERLLRNAALQEIIPADQYDNTLLSDRFLTPGDPAALGYEQAQTAFIARAQNRVRAVILPVRAPDGYTGAIDMLAGVDSKGQITGVRIISHRETPGLGDKIEIQKSPWVLDFNRRSLRDPSPEQWTTKRDGGSFDQFTGATITPRAVIEALRRMLEYVSAESDNLYYDENSTATAGQSIP